MTRLSRLAALSAAATFLLIALGGLSRTQTGPGCPDWPLCQGSWLPPLDLAPLVDWLHRSVSATIGLVLLATAIRASRTPESSAGTRRAAWAAVGLLVLQSGVGALTVGASPAGAWASTLHLGLAMLLFAATLLTFFSAALDPGLPGWLAGDGDPVVRRAALGGAAMVLVLILSSAAANAAAVAVACTSWPLCPEGLAPAALAPVGPGYGVATVTAAIVAAVVGGLAWWRRQPLPLRLVAAGGLGLAALQGMVGAAAGIAGHAEWIGPVYLATLTLLLAAMLAVAVLATGVGSAAAMGGPAIRLAPLPAGTAPGSGLAEIAGGVAGRLRERVADYVALTKPGIMSLLLTTTLGAMLIASAGLPPFWLTLATLLGGVLASGGANVLNCFIDRDIDAQMARTRHRASAAGRVSPGATLAFGVGLTALAVVGLWLVVNPLAALLALAGNLFYVFVYTLWLKRRTPQNIVIGGAAGAVPPLVGWAAVSGDLSPLAWGLFGVIFLWTPPHFWSLALLKQGEYGRVGVPMLPNVAGEAETRKQVLVYTLLLTLLCLGLVPLGLGPVYLASTVAINGVFLLYALRLYRRPSKQTARGMFFYSLWYLALVFGAAVADRMLLG